MKIGVIYAPSSNDYSNFSSRAEKSETNRHSSSNPPHLGYTKGLAFVGDKYSFRGAASDPLHEAIVHPHHILYFTSGRNLRPSMVKVTCSTLVMSSPKWKKILQSNGFLLTSITRVIL